LRRSIFAAMGVCAVIAAVTLGPRQLRPETGHPNLERALAFGLLGVATVFAMPRRPLAAGSLLVLVAVVTEALQLVTPDRHGRVSDALVKAAGGILGVAAGYAAQAVIQATRGEKP
jgi:VanZ family protein